MGLDVLKLADLEVTECDFRESRRVPPVSVVGESIENFKPVQIVPTAHEAVEDEELDYDVDDVQDFDEEVQSGQVGAIALRAQEAHDFVSLLTHTHQGVVLVLTVSLQPSVQVLGYVSDSFVSLARVSELGTRHHGHHLVHVDAGSAVEHPPDESWEFEEECHEEEDDGHPLVVGEFLGVPVVSVYRDGRVHGNVVSVLHPAVALRVRRKRAREVCRTPALDGVADILSAGDEDSEEREEDDGVEMVQSVYPVVV